MEQPTARLDPVGARAGQIRFSRTARTVLVDACRRDRRQAVLLSWPGGATYLPRECYRPGDFDVVVGHVAGCPIYADMRRLSLFRDRRVLLDAEARSRTRPRPPLQATTIPPPPPPGTYHEPSRRESAFARAEARVARELVRDLDNQFAGAYPQEEISMHVRRAIHDLRGSVSAEALPELAVRLARHRLAQEPALSR
ncbi:MAG TPA: hypothetical protein VE442_03860 [Jatrophihabitans sp.]|jgi:hypothetical protein|nr:hypothetical protein [Jatrophihabitans sp.]